LLLIKVLFGVVLDGLWPTGTFEAFFDALAAMTETAHLVQMFDSTVVRAHVSAAGAKGGKTVRLSVVDLGFAVNRAKTGKAVDHEVDRLIRTILGVQAVLGIPQPPAINRQREFKHEN
jgi:hypothetical protein